MAKLWLAVDDSPIAEVTCSELSRPAKVLAKHSIKVLKEGQSSSTGVTIEIRLYMPSVPVPIFSIASPFEHRHPQEIAFSRFT